MKNIPDKFFMFLLEKYVQEKENELKISTLRKARLAKFIIDLLFDSFMSLDFNTKLSLIYSKSHDYNKHPYTYGGELSVHKVYVHLINLDDDYLIEIIHNMTK